MFHDMRVEIYQCFYLLGNEKVYNITGNIFGKDLGTNPYQSYAILDIHIKIVLSQNLKNYEHSYIREDVLNMYMLKNTHLNIVFHWNFDQKRLCS